MFALWYALVQIINKKVCGLVHQLFCKCRRVCLFSIFNCVFNHCPFLLITFMLSMECDKRFQLIINCNFDTSLFQSKIRTVVALCPTVFLLCPWSIDCQNAQLSNRLFVYWTATSLHSTLPIGSINVEGSYRSDHKVICTKCHSSWLSMFQPNYMCIL
jgi:hypothetical protein